MSPPATLDPRPPLVFDPFDYDQQDDPFPVYRWLRDEAPVYWNDEHRFWALSRYDDVAAAALDPGRFCSGQGVSVAGPPGGRTIIKLDPPRHTDLRRLARRSFSPAVIATYTDRIQEVTDALLDPLEGRGSFDACESFADLLPLRVISHLLAIPQHDVPVLLALTHRYLLREPGDPARTEDGHRAMADLLAHVDAHVERLRAHPGDDVVSVLIGDADAGRLSAEELRHYVLLLLVAGFETTTKTLANATYWLWRYPDERRRLVEEPHLLAGAVEELLRYDGATPHMARTLTEDVELHGVTMRRGDKVLLLFASANRDERRWEEPDRLDVTRDARGHLSFGFGIHLCLGAWLARLELRIALGGLLARFPDYEVVEERLLRTHTANNRGYYRVPLVVPG